VRNPYDPDYFRAEDLELWCRLSLRDAGLIEEPLYFYREAVPLNIKAYLASCRTSRKILRRYGPAICGSGTTSLLLMKRWIKECVYRFSGPLGYQRSLLKRRGPELQMREKVAASRTLSLLQTTPVPGLRTSSIRTSR
jgi:hypothetical protein